MFDEVPHFTQAEMKMDHVMGLWVSCHWGVCIGLELCEQLPRAVLSSLEIDGCQQVSIYKLFPSCSMCFLNHAIVFYLKLFSF